MTDWRSRRAADVAASGDVATICLLRQLDCELALGLGHFSPEFLQVRLYGLIVGIFAQSQREPAICGGKVVRRAQARRIERSHFDHRPGIALIGGDFQQTQATIAVLRDAAASVKIFLRFGDRIDWLGCRCRFRGDWRGRRRRVG
jgi:hypothetical protein